MHTSYTKHKHYQLLAPILLLFIKFCLFTSGLSFFCGVNGVENGLLTCDQAVLLLLLFGRRKWKLRTPNRRLWVINSNCFFYASFRVIPWIWITFTLWLTGNQSTLFHSVMHELIFRSVGFAVWFVGLIRYLKVETNKSCSKNSVVSKNAVTPLHRSCSLRVMGD